MKPIRCEMKTISCKRDLNLGQTLIYVDLVTDISNTHMQSQYLQPELQQYSYKKSIS